MSNEIAQRVSFSAMISTPSYKKAINNALKDPNRVSRFVAAITSAVAVNPALQECDPSTILSGALLGESLNLSPSPQLGQYYLVPFKQNAKYDRQGNMITPDCCKAQFVLGYKGYIQLALRSDQYKRLNVMAVKNGELVHWDPLTEDIELNIMEDEGVRDAAPTIGYIAMFEYLNGFRKTLYWSREKMERHADRYSKAFSLEATGGKFPKVSFHDYMAGNFPKGDEWKYSSFWYKDFDGMAFKTMIRQLISKWGIMSIDLRQAFEADTSLDGSSPDILDVAPVELPAVDGSQQMESQLPDEATTAPAPSTAPHAEETVNINEL